MPLTPARSPCPPHSAAELPQGGCGPPGDVGGGRGLGSELGVLERRWRGLGLGDAHGGGWSGKRSSVHGGRGMRTWCGHGPRGGARGATKSGAGPWGGIAVPQGAGAVPVELRVGEARWHRGKRESWGRECLVGGVGGAVPFVRAGSSAGRVRQLGSCPWRRGGLLRCCQVLGGGGVPRPPCICCVGVLRRVRWVRRHGRQLVRIQWWLRGVFSVGVGLGGLRSFSVDVVAGEIMFLVGGGQPLVVDMVVGLSGGWCPWGCRAGQIVAAGFRAVSTETADEGSHVPGWVWPAVGVV